MTIYSSILATVGRTPVVRLNHIAPKGVEVFVKLEAFNPMHSVKDRLAMGVIEAAERSGALKPGMTVIEATSGNTGIALAMVCAAKGYPFVATMVETFSIERRKLMKFLGAKVVLTPKEEKGSGMVRKAEELAKKHGWFLTRQFANPANPAYHRQTTAAEILTDFTGRKLDYFVSGWGTGGTLTGVGSMLKLARPDCRIVACEPEKAALLSGNQFTPHMIQGWTPDFVPEVLDKKMCDEIQLVKDEEAIETSKLLARKEGIFTGISGGATCSVGLRVAQRAKEGQAVLIMLPDTGERYLSTPLFADITADSDNVD
ncbi:hypothetical protein HK101_010966 [Irineochytrium annulatum]|nr:hypothetical protein HK101_010966 [Irineochytrium annulatum]